MRRTLIVIAALLVTPAAAMAQTERMSDARYLTASRCIAYAELPQLGGDSFNVSALKQALNGQYRHPVIRDRAEETARNVRRSGARAGDDERAVSNLRADRDESCAAFVPTGMVSLGAQAPAS